MDLHDFNARVLASIGIVDETGKGHLSRVVGEGTSPFTINGKRVVLPTSEHLRSSGEGTIVYHPLSENITRGESDMIKSLRDTVMYKLTLTGMSLITELGRVAATPSEHKRLDASSQKYLKQLSEMDERTYEFLKKVLMRISAEPEKRLVSISLRKSGKDKNADGVLRSVMFKFPVLDSILADEPDLLGVKYPSKKARNSIKALFEIVLGDEATRAGFDYGSKNMVAPYFHALMLGYYNVAQHFNGLIEQHRKLLGDDLADELVITTDWYEGLDNLPEMRKIVPVQEGNEGAIIVAEPKAKEEVTRKAAARIAPPNRDRPVQEKAPTDLPWDDEPTTRREPAPRTQPTKPRAKSLDDFLYGGPRDDDRRSSFGRRAEDRGDRSSLFAGRERREERDFGRGTTRRFDIGSDDRSRGSRFGRDERGMGRRSFGAGGSRTGF